MRKIATTFLLLVSSWSLIWGQNLPVESIRVSLNAPSISIGALLDEMTRQTGMEFAYHSRIIDLSQVVSINLSNADLTTSLATLETQLGLSAKIVEGLIVLTLPEEPVQPQPPTYAFSGHVHDAKTGESLIGAVVYVPGTNQGTTTDAFGNFTLLLPARRYDFVCDYVGFEQQPVSVSLQRDVYQKIPLNPASIDLPNVIVDETLNAVMEKNQLGQIDFSAKMLQNMPEFGGESGLVKGLHSLPGVSMHSDGSAFFYTRGGERDQNLIIIDDAPIYNPSHLFGFYALVIPDFAKSIKVYKSDMPTSVGDRLSSIVSIRTKDGNLNQTQISGAINPLINRISFETPVFKKQGSIFASVRRSSFEWLYKRRLPNWDFYFGDANLKLNYKINKNNRLYLTIISSRDNFTNENEANAPNAGIRWGNFASTLRWNHSFSPKLFANTMLYTANYGYQIFFDPNIWQSRLSTVSFKTDFTQYGSSNYKAKFGFELQGFFIDPGSFTLDTAIAVLPQIKSNYNRKTVLYYQGNWKLSPKWTINAGLRMVSWANLGPATYYSYDKNYAVTDTTHVGSGVYNKYNQFDPRFSVQFAPTSQSEFKFSLGNYHQYLQLISNSISPFTSLEVWLPASPHIKPQSSFQVALSYAQSLKPSKWEWNASVYHKKFYNQIDYKDHPNTLFNPLLEGELRFGTMKSYGLELGLKKSYGKWRGQLNYAHSRAIRKTDDLNGGEPYPAFQDVPHSFNIVMEYQAKPRVLLSGVWTSYSGYTFTSPSRFYQFNGQTVPIYDTKNNDRLPTYRRLDLACKFLLNKDLEKRFQHSLTFSIYNALMHKNVIAVNFNRIPSAGPRPVVPANLLSDIPLSASQVDLIRFLPSLTYKFKY